MDIVKSVRPRDVAHTPDNDQAGEDTLTAAKPILERLSKDMLRVPTKSPNSCSVMQSIGAGFCIYARRRDFPISRWGRCCARGAPRFLHGSRRR